MTKYAVEVDRGNRVPGSQLDDQIAMNAADAGSPRTIKPPFVARAKAARARSISPGVAHVDRAQLHPERRRRGLDRAQLPGSGAWRDPEGPPTRVTRGAICLSSSSHFPLMPYSN